VLAAAYLLVAGLAGFAVLTRAAPAAPAIVRLPGGFLLAVVFTSWTTYAVALGSAELFGWAEQALRVGLVVSTVLATAVLVALIAAGRGVRPRDLRIPRLDAVLAALAVTVSWWFMHARLREENGETLVSANTWGDLGLHGALSRSFSVGANYPTEYPFFAGEPIRYHFGFDFFAAMLQEGGFSLLWSFNLPAIIGFTAMLLTTFAIARLLFSPADPPRWWRDRGVWAGLVAMALLLTNQSLGWLRYVQEDGDGSLLTALRPSVLWAHEGYLTGGPYTDDRIVMFNTPNAYLTQTHLIVAMAVVLLLVHVLLAHLGGLGDAEAPDRRLLAGVGLTFGVGFWLNGVVWLAAAVFLGGLLLLGALAARSDRRRLVDWLRAGAWFAVPALALAVPQALLLNGGRTEGGVGVHLGYLTCASTASSCHGGDMNLLSVADWWSFLQYWWLNEGAFIPLLALAFALGSWRDRRIIAATTFVFLWGSVVQVGQDVGGQNHKVFNLWENLAAPFVALALVMIWVSGGRLLKRHARGIRLRSVGAKVITVSLAAFLVVSGVIDAMTVKNDYVVGVFGDDTQQDAMDWIIAETPLRSTFLTDYDQLYTAPTMAGRGIALGYSSWASSAGYDVTARQEAIAAIYSAASAGTACALLATQPVDYVLVGPQERTSPRFELNEALFDGWAAEASFGVDATTTRIYRVADVC